MHPGLHGVPEQCEDDGLPHGYALHRAEHVARQHVPSSVPSEPGPDDRECSSEAPSYPGRRAHQPPIGSEPVRDPALQEGCEWSGLRQKAWDTALLCYLFSAHPRFLASCDHDGLSRF